MLWFTWHRDVGSSAICEFFRRRSKSADDVSAITSGLRSLSPSSAELWSTASGCADWLICHGRKIVRSDAIQGRKNNPGADAGCRAGTSRAASGDDESESSTGVAKTTSVTNEPVGRGGNKPRLVLLAARFRSVSPSERSFSEIVWQLHDETSMSLSFRMHKQVILMYCKMLNNGSQIVND